ncbi:hypothetical protein Q7P37_010854 [Cladosporium fusiforme]
MEDLEVPTGSPVRENGQEPEGNNDPGDIQKPEIEEEHGRTPPMAEPTDDMDAQDDEAVPGDGDDDEQPNNDADSDLDELDEAQFDNFDPESANINVPDQPVAVDDSNVGQLGVHKRKRVEGEDGERKKKKKEGRREKAKKVRAGGDDEDNFEGGPEMEGSRRKKAGTAAKKAPRARSPENEDNLSPEERRRRALDRKMDEALRSNKPSRRKAGGIDLEAAGDAELEEMRQRMANACQADAAARQNQQVATHKLKLLPSVVELLNKNTLRSSIVDPDINILEAVRFFLEPADTDAALPNYQIQRELFSILGRLSMTKEALIASGIAKVMVFYTKSSQTQPAIKRQAERLVSEWMRIVLGKRKDMRAKTVQSATYDPMASSQRPGGSQIDRAALAAEKRRRALEIPVVGNRARVQGTVGTYTIAPVNNLSNVIQQDNRRLGSSGEEAFRKVATRATGKR